MGDGRRIVNRSCPRRDSMRHSPRSDHLSMGDIDISWQMLCRIVQSWAGATAELTEFLPLHGGQINTTLELHLADGRKAVVKVSPHRVDKNYQREAHQLVLLKNAGIP